MRPGYPDGDDAHAVECVSAEAGSLLEDRDDAGGLWRDGGRVLLADPPHRPKKKAPITSRTTSRTARISATGPPLNHRFNAGK